MIRGDPHEPQHPWKGPSVVVLPGCNPTAVVGIVLADFPLMAKKPSARRQVEAMGWHPSPLPENPYAGWAANVETVEKDLQTSIAKGLTDEEAETRLERYGPNELEKEAATPFWKLVLEQVSVHNAMRIRSDTMHLLIKI